jgi:Xaa-Pro dipeptidase
MTITTSLVRRGSGPLTTPIPFSDAEYQRRLDGLRKQMAMRDLDAFISFTPENLYYHSAHDTPGYYFYQAMIVTHDHLPINVTRRIESTNTLGRGWARLAVPYEDREDPAALTLDVLAELGVVGKRVGAEASAWFVSPARYAQMAEGVRSSGGEFLDASGLVESLRVVKSAEELSYIREAAMIASRAMETARRVSHEGTNENDVAAEVVAALIRSGGEYAGLPPFVTSGPRTTLCHSTWSGRVFEKNDVLNFELPGVVSRYCAALYRAGTIGEPDDEFKRRVDAGIEALEAVIAAIKPGAVSADLNEVHMQVFEKYGYRGRSQSRTGYSVGINYPPDWGEGHILSIWSGDPRPLEAGMTFHLVPGMQGSSLHSDYHICTSETVLVTETGCEVLTNFPRESFVV